ncbi:MAG: hypothetical protein ACHQHN_17840 [Sphingobacteriales bacterium]
MTNENLNPEEEQGNNQSEEQTLNQTSDEVGHSLEKNGPDKSKDPKVLHKDGSFADLPYNNEPGGGALEGTVGIGT